MSEPERRFVVLHHVTREGEHWDLMLERDGVLATWQLSVQPQSLAAVGASILARRISDHRLAYLEYEGPVSGDRGYVQRVDAGTYRFMQQGQDRWVVGCSGQVLRGQLVIDATGIGHEGRVTRIA